MFVDYCEVSAFVSTAQMTECCGVIAIFFRLIAAIDVFITDGFPQIGDNSQWPSDHLQSIALC